MLLSSFRSWENVFDRSTLFLCVFAPSQHLGGRGETPAPALAILGGRGGAGNASVLAHALLQLTTAVERNAAFWERSSTCLASAASNTFRGAKK